MKKFVISVLGAIGAYIVAVLVQAGGGGNANYTSKVYSIIVSPGYHFLPLLIAAVAFVGFYWFLRKR